MEREVGARARPRESVNTRELPAEHAETLKSELIDAAFRVIRRRIEEDGPIRAGLLPLDWMEAQDVAEEAGASADVFDDLFGSAQHHREGTLSPYEAFLFDTFGTYRGPILTERQTEATVEHLDSLEDLILVAGANLALNDDDWLGFLMTLSTSCFSLHQRPDYVVFFEEVEYLYTQLLYQFGLRVRAPLTVRDLAMSLAAVFEGSWMRAVYRFSEPEPEVMYKASPTSEPKHWTLGGIAGWAIIQAMTEPVE